jgi:putative membrane protein
MNIIVNWLVSALSIMVSAYVLPGVQLEGFFPALVAAVVLGLVNAVIKPILLLLTLPINLLTLGLFTVVINALLVWFTSKLVPGFHIANFG